MQSRLFSSKSSDKTQLDVTIEWRTHLSAHEKKQVIRTGVEAFLDLYKDHTEEALGLTPGLVKRTWLTDMMTQSALPMFENGGLHLAIATVNDSVAGIIMCKPVTARQEDLKTDLYISILTVKPLYSLLDPAQKIRIGLGKQLLESAIARFSEANTVTLDTRRINTSGIAFYQALGFAVTEDATYGGYDLGKYVGLEKSVMRTI